MYSSERSNYVVLQNFTTTFPIGQSNVVYSYIKGEFVTLRNTGITASNWLREGKIKKV